MGRKRVVCHELVRDLPRESRLEPARNIDAGQLHTFAFVVDFQFPLFTFKLSVFCIGLRVNRYIFSSRHRHSTCNQSSESRDENTVARRARGSHADDKTRGRDNPVIGAENGGAQPSYTTCLMAFAVFELHPFRIDRITYWWNFEETFDRPQRRVVAIQTSSSRNAVPREL